MKFYKHWLGDHLKHTLALTGVEEGMYRRLLDSYYATERPLPADMNKCFAISRAITNEDKKAVEDILNLFFTLDKDGYRNKRADKEIGEYNESSDRKSRAGKAGARARWPSKRTIVDTTDASVDTADASVDTADANATAMASHSHSQSHSHNQSQEPHPEPQPQPQPKPERSEKKDLYLSSAKSENKTAAVNGSAVKEEPAGPNAAWEIVLEYRAYGKSMGKNPPPKAIMKSFPHTLWETGDKQASRMAFIEQYKKNLLKYGDEPSVKPKIGGRR